MINDTLNDSPATPDTPTSDCFLRDLGRDFQVAALGEGDANLGFNTLAAMALTLANLAPTRGSRLDTRESPTRLGVQLMVCGAASASLVRDEVVTAVGSRQANFLRQLQRSVDDAMALAARQNSGLPELAGSPGSTERMMRDLFADSGSSFAQPAEILRGAMEEAPSDKLPDLLHHSKFMVTAPTPEKLASQLNQLRPGHPLVYMGLHKPDDLISLGEIGSALMEGRFPLEGSNDLVEARLLLTDSLGLLQDAAKHPHESTAWLGLMLWLMDGKAGPEAPPYPDNEAEREQTISLRFSEALNEVLTARFQVQGSQLPSSPNVPPRAKVRFKKFLHKMEERFPGVSASCQRLLDSLAFGLGMMAGVDLVQNGRARPRPPVAQIEALARFLVKRMVNARTEMIHEGLVAQRRSQIERVYRKLSQQPSKRRDIYRNLSMSARDCDACLDWMENAGVIEQVRSQKWAIVKNAGLDFTRHTTPLIEA